MRVAFVVGRFPLISETFILNEITGLLERGHAVSVYSLYGRPEDAVKVHADVERYDLLSHTRYVPKVPRSRFRRVAGGVRLLIANGYKDPLVSLRSLNVMKFGRQSASLRLLYRSLPLLGCGAYDIVHGDVPAAVEFGRVAAAPVNTLRQQTHRCQEISVCF